jgi:hypothetical protein
MDGSLSGIYVPPTPDLKLAYLGYSGLNQVIGRISNEETLICSFYLYLFINFIPLLEKIAK